MTMSEHWLIKGAAVTGGAAADIHVKDGVIAAVGHGLDASRMALLPEHAIVMHPGPMNRGVEIAPEVADGRRSVIREQVNNGVAIRMAVLSAFYP